MCDCPERHGARQPSPGFPAPPPPSGAVPCDLCQATDTDELSLTDRDGGHLRTVICRRCGLVYSDPRPTPEQVREYYERAYRLDYKASFQPKPKHVFRAGKVAVDRVRRISLVLSPGCRALDVGAGGGEVVYVLRALGYDASGFEPNEGYAQFAVEVLKVPVSHAFYQDARIENESQDVVTMFHVLEHFESPRNALEHVQRWLRPSGRLVVEVPNVEGVCQWPGSTFHRAHLYNFNPATLEMAGRRAGYTVANSSLSSDGGNLTVVFQKSGATAPSSYNIPGNCARVGSIFRRHTAWRHLLSPFPYLRPFHKLAARIEERLGTRNADSPRAILDRLIARELKRGESRAPIQG